MPLHITTVSSLLFILLSTIAIISFYLINKLRTITLLKDTVDNLTRTVRSLDYQAKLIIKSDIELKLYQEEVEDKLNKLTLLKNLIIASIHMLDKEQLFAQIDEKIVNDLGFKKCLILGLEDLAIKTRIGFNESDAETVKNLLFHKKMAFKTSFFLTGESELCKDLLPYCERKDLLIAPVKARENIYALFLLAEHITTSEIKTAEKEIATIICMYLGQCLDNIKLFEELYRSKEELETKIRERTAELVRSLREIEVVSKTKTDFISSVSHELRTPLTSVKGFSALLVDGKFGKLPPEAQDRLKKIDENVNKLVDMVNMLLDIARIESGKMEIKIAPTDIVHLVKDVGDFLMPQMQTKGIRFNVVTPESLIVYIDKNLIDRVLVNLVNNAIKFTPANGEIKITCRQEATRAVITVSDTGMGIEKENLDRIFQEFFKIDNVINREMRGTGLGLSLVKRIIETHKEHIWVESEPDRGTTFYFTLKLCETM